MAAVDMLSMLVEVVPQILALYPGLPTRITQALCYAIAGEYCMQKLIQGQRKEFLSKLVLFLLKSCVHTFALYGIIKVSSHCKLDLA